MDGRKAICSKRQPGSWNVPFTISAGFYEAEAQLRVGIQPVSVGGLDFNQTATSSDSALWTMIGFAERIAATALLFFALPLLAITALVIAMLSRRSPLIAHRRVGQHGKEIWVLKLRTMWRTPKGMPRFRPFIERCSSETIPDSKRQSDSRVTSRFAAVCRKYSIDEWPQLWHVICADMGLVGPRPLTMAELVKYYGSDSICLLAVKPGITGLWQVKGRSRLTYAQRRRLDLFLVRHWSFGLYTKILNATLPLVLRGKDAW